MKKLVYMQIRKIKTYISANSSTLIKNVFMKKKNAEVQSRRDFFKKTTKATLSILGFVALGALPIRLEAKSATDCQSACVSNCGYACTSCWTGCTGSCKGCTGKCEGTCKGGCNANCSKNCTTTCSGRCTSGCGWQAQVAW